ncbi:unnamed protein product [Ixodes persulcatus]
MHPTSGARVAFYGLGCLVVVLLLEGEVWAFHFFHHKTQARAALPPPHQKANTAPRLAGSCVGPNGEILKEGETRVTLPACERLSCHQRVFRLEKCGPSGKLRKGCKLLKGYGAYPQCCGFVTCTS